MRNPPLCELVPHRLERRVEYDISAVEPSLEDWKRDRTVFTMFGAASTKWGGDQVRCDILVWDPGVCYREVAGEQYRRKQCPSHQEKYSRNSFMHQSVQLSHQFYVGRPSSHLFHVIAPSMYQLCTKRSCTSPEPRRAHLSLMNSLPLPPKLRFWIQQAVPIYVQLPSRRNALRHQGRNMYGSWCRSEGGAVQLVSRRVRE